MTILSCGPTQEHEQQTPWISPSIPRLVEPNRHGDYGLRTLSEAMFDYVDTTDNLPSGANKMGRYELVSRIASRKRGV